MDEKTRIRAECLARRRAIEPRDAAEKSRAIRERVLALPEIRDADTVLAYASSKDNEVDTHGLIDALLAQGKTVLVPIAGPRRVLEWSRLAALSELAPARFGILEPKPESTRPTAPPVDAPVLVPGLGFTREGYRVGYGGGYFDRFLAKHRGPSVGLAYDQQLIDSFNVQLYDIPLDIIVAESFLIRSSLRRRKA